MTDYQIVLQYEDTTNHKVIKSDDLKTFLDSVYPSFYAFILHDCDLKIDLTPKTKHYHIVVRFNREINKKQVLNLFASWFMINRNLITCQWSFDLIHAIRYLPHLDEKDKYRYPLVEVQTNKQDIVNKCFNNQIDDIDMLEFQSFDIDVLIKLCKKCKSKTEVFRALGLSMSNRYKGLISMIWEDLIK